MEVIADDIDRRHFSIRDHEPLFVGVRVELTSDLQASFCCRRADQINDDLITHQWSRTPVMADE